MLYSKQADALKLACKKGPTNECLTVSRIRTHPASRNQVNESMLEQLFCVATYLIEPNSDAKLMLQNGRLVEKNFFKFFSCNASNMMQIDRLSGQERVRTCGSDHG
jgi:hypothetical protein